MDDLKKSMLEALNAAHGNVSKACEQAGVERRLYYRWRRRDPEFAAEADSIRDEMTDAAEEKLMERIKAGDTQAITFYLKTRGKSRGYSTTMIRAGETSADGTVASVGCLQMDEEERKKTEKKDRECVSRKKKAVKNKKDYLVKLLKKQGKYSPEMSVQAQIAARLLVRCDELEDEIFKASHAAVKTEYSREGNERQVAASSEKLYMTYMTYAQRALRALGMNTDGKEVKANGGDGLDNFLKAFGEDE